MSLIRNRSNSIYFTGIVAVCTLLITLPAFSQTGYEAFLKLEGPDIKGEVVDKDHKDWIEILGFSWGASHDGSHSRGTVGDLRISKPLDRSSPSLFLQCVKGTHLATGRLHLREPGGEKDVIYEILLEEVYIRSIETIAAESGGRPVEEVTLSFGRIEVAYTFRQPDGTSKRTSVWWDRRSNTGGSTD